MDKLKHKLIVSTGATLVSLWVFDMGVVSTIVTFASTFVTV